MKEKLAKTNQSIEKTLQIIDVLANHQSAMRLQEISKETEMPASTVLRMLNTLYKYNYVTQDAETLKYSLTLKFAQIGSKVKSQYSINDISRPFLLELSTVSHEAACIAIEQDMEILYIDTVDGPDRILKTMQRIGKRAPMHSTGVGKLMMLNFDEAQLDAYIIKSGLRPLTKHTITNKEDLILELAKIRKQNFAIDDEECEIGMRCIAAPIRDYSGKIIACISVSGPLIRMSLEKISTLKDAVISTAEKISGKYAYRAG